MNDLRIRRRDPGHLVIERRKQTERGPRWVIASAHGSAWSLACALIDLAADTPGGADLVPQLDRLVSLIDERTERIAGQIQELLQQEPNAVIELDSDGHQPE